ncbi:MAG: glycosyltransferase family 4 protein [Mesorhizobium sp.]
MHLVFATSLVPAGKPATGYEIANAAIIAALRRAGARVTVIGYIWPGATPSDPDNTVVLGEVDVRTDTASGRQRAAWLLKAMQAGMTFASIKLRATSPAEVKAALARIEPFDAYILNAVQFAAAFEEVLADKPSIFVAHNVEYRSAQENAAAASGIVARTLYWREAKLLKLVEARLCARADYVWTLAEEDRELLGIDDPSRSACLPMTVAVETPQALGPRKPAFDAGLIGSWTWQPNRIGLDWFLDEVTPHLPEDFTIQIAGKMPSGVTASHPGVEFCGFVESAEEFVRQARVIPLISRAGTGVQLKTIETFELGLPSVVTSSSLRGIANRPDNCVVVDDPRAFATALVEAVRNPMADVDGRIFHDAQRALLDRRIAAGLARLSQSRQEVAA